MISFDAGPLQLLEYSVVMHRINNSLESNTTWLLNLLLKWLICGNDYLTFYKNVEYKVNRNDMEIHKEVLVLLTCLFTLFAQ